MTIYKILDKIEKKIEKIEQLHDKESMMCEEVKDLIAEAKEESSEDEEWEDNEEEDSEFDDEEEIDEEQEN